MTVKQKQFFKTVHFFKVLSMRHTVRCVFQFPRDWAIYSSSSPPSDSPRGCHLHYRTVTECGTLPERVKPFALAETDAVQRVDLTVLPGEVLGAVP